MQPQQEFNAAAAARQCSTTSILTSSHQDVCAHACNDTAAGVCQLDTCMYGPLWRPLIQLSTVCVELTSDQRLDTKIHTTKKKAEHKARKCELL